MDQRTSSRPSNKTVAARCLKWLLLFVSGLLTLSGCCLVGVAVFVQLSEKFHGSLMTHLTIGASALGGGTILIAMLGCYAVIARKSAIYIAYLAFIIIGLLASSVVSSWLFLQRNTLPEDTRSALRSTVDSYFSDEGSRQLMNNIQNKLECCGVDHGFGDYGAQLGFDVTTVCEMQFYPQPCKEPLSEYFSQKLVLVLVITTATGVVLLLDFSLSLVMFCLITRQMEMDEDI